MRRAIRKVLFIRPPRYPWVFMTESDYQVMSLGYPCVAAAIRQRCPGIAVKIIDCVSLKLGWKGLAQMLREERPDVVGASEEIVGHAEVGRLFRLAKDLDPGVTTMAGGHFFSWMTRYGLRRYPVDVIVRFEGEETAADVVATLAAGGELSGVPGIAFSRDGEAVETPLRPLIKDLDQTPLPAFDLLTMNRRSSFGSFWPQGVTLERARGCTQTCSFCPLWTYWGRQTRVDVEAGRLEVTPCYRSKSVSRMLEELDVVYHKHGRRSIFWADGTFNEDPEWMSAFCDRVIRKGYRDLHWWAFVRSDHLLRDERSGVLEKMVRCGLDHVLIGVERERAEDLAKVNKAWLNSGVTRSALGLLRKKYPHVYRGASLLTCLPDDDASSMRGVVSFARSLDVDHAIIHPVIAQPGTVFYEEARQEGLLEIGDFSEYDWLKPATRSRSGLSRADLAVLSLDMKKAFFRRRSLAWFFERLFSPYRRKRSSYWFFMGRVLRLCVMDIWSSATRQKTDSAFLRLHKPAGYED